MNIWPKNTIPDGFHVNFRRKKKFFPQKKANWNMESIKPISIFFSLHTLIVNCPSVPLSAGIWFGTSGIVLYASHPHTF